MQGFFVGEMWKTCVWTVGNRPLCRGMSIVHCIENYRRRWPFGNALAKQEFAPMALTGLKEAVR
jgi:hypothetical protein